MDSSKPSDESYRHRWSTIDVLFQKARKSRREQTITFSAYSAFVSLLRDEEIVIFTQAGAHEFADLTENNYWRRGKLKFPSSLQNEVRLVGEGKDPALEQR